MASERGIQNNIIIFEVSRAYIGSIDQRVLFTDGNASNQQLSKSAEEKVDIVPATTSNDSCRRNYLPDGRPHGTNTKCSDFYADVAFLDRVSWDVIDGHFFVKDREEYKRVKHAEVLTPDRFPLDEMLNICVSTEDMVDTVRTLFVDLGLTEEDFHLPIVYKPGLFH
jgi:ssDNA thymidine ADP-ribosyltransferase DarT-like protein